MNKEEILNTFLLANIPEIITQEEFDDVKKAIKDLQQKLENSIPVSLVEKKIEELIKEGRHYNANKIEVLQELLEKR